MSNAWDAQLYRRLRPALQAAGAHLVPGRYRGLEIFPQPGQPGVLPLDRPGVAGADRRPCASVVVTHPAGSGPTGEARIPLPRHQQVVADSQAQCHGGPHAGPQTASAATVSLESGRPRALHRQPAPGIVDPANP